MSPRTLVALAALSVVLQTLWALTVTCPKDMDAQYYLLVARSIASGQGAATSSLWNLSVLPPALPAPADLHWMPLPSRVLVPFVWLWPAGGAALAQILMASAWPPLAAVLARDLGASERVAIGAGVFAATGGVYVWVLSQPDCYALYGLIGTVGLLAVARQHVPWAAAMALLAALTRNDGFLFGLCLAAGVSGRGRIIVAAAGLLGTAAWSARNVWVGGEEYLYARQVALHAGDYLAVFDGVSHAPIGIVGHLLGPVTQGAAAVEYAVTPGLLLLTPFTWWGMVVFRGRPWVRSLILLVFAVPLVSLVIAPTVSAHGTLYRSAAATFPAQMALATVMLVRGGAWASDKRGYAPAFVPGIVGGGFVFLVMAMGVMRVTEPGRPAECPAVAELPPGVPVFTSRPLEMELRCGRPGVMITRGGDPERLAEASRRYGIRHVVAASEVTDEGSISVADVPRLLPDWAEQAPGLFAAP